MTREQRIAAGKAEWRRPPRPPEGAANRLFVHGRRSVPEYRVWKNIKQRCHNPANPSYANYGGRGIFVCQAWRESFPAFLGDMGARPSPRHSIDRIDNNRGYEPGNCRWATMRQQCRNRRGLAMVTVDGRSVCLLEACEMRGVSYAKVRARTEKGVPFDEAVRLVMADQERGWVARRDSKLSESQAREIYAKKGSASSSVVASGYGVSPATVQLIWRGRLWGGVKREAEACAKAINDEAKR